MQQAKDLVENAPKELKKEISKEDAEAIVATLKAVGGVAVLE